MRMRLLVAMVLLVAAAAPAAASIDAFARCLTQAGARFYGTSWCPHCAAQRRMFGNAFADVDYVECSVKGTREVTEECQEAGVTSFPTWEFKDGSRAQGRLTLQQLAQRTGCSLGVAGGAPRGAGERRDGVPEPVVLDVPSQAGGVVKLPGAERVQIIDVP